MQQQKPQQQVINIPVVSYATSGPPLLNPPRRDLIDGTRADYYKIGVPLYEAAIKCDWEAAKAIFDKYPKLELVNCSITESGETALHIATSANRSEHVEMFVKNLVGLMKIEDLARQNEGYNTALYLAAVIGNVKTAKIMLEKNRDLLTIRGSQGNYMPLYTAALYGNHEVVKYLYGKSNDLRDNYWTPKNRGDLLERCVENDMFDVSIKILKKHPDLASSRGGSILNALAKKPDAFAETKTSFIRIISWCKHFFSLINITHRPSPNEYPEHGNGRVPGDAARKVETTSSAIRRTFKHIRRTINSAFALLSFPLRAPERDCEALLLLKIILEDIAKKPNYEISSILRGPPDHKGAKTYSSRVLFTAAKMGNTKLIVEFIRLYPDLIWDFNDNGLSLFHVAVQHRQEGVYNLLYDIGALRFMIATLQDTYGNNILHCVGRNENQKQLENVSGAALQMQRELLWFQEVESMLPKKYGEHKNKEGLTPHELFLKEHKDLVTLGEKWMRGTANQCMVVAALIATIVFAAAFTVPGGYAQTTDQNNGIPVFHSKATFMVFVVADAISLFSSSVSVLMFLSILTSRYAQHDFLDSLPKKLMLGLGTLFISITTMTIAFSVSFFVLYHKGLLWMPILIGTFAVLPVILYTLLQYSLFSDVIRSTYRSRYLFKPNKHLLYSENPKV